MSVWFGKYRTVDPQDRMFHDFSPVIQALCQNLRYYLRLIQWIQHDHFNHQQTKRWLCQRLWSHLEKWDKDITFTLGVKICKDITTKISVLKTWGPFPSFPPFSTPRVLHCFGQVSPKALDTKAARSCCRSAASLFRASVEIIVRESSAKSKLFSMVVWIWPEHRNQKKKRSKRSRNLRTQREVIDFFIGDGAMVFPLKGLRAFPLKITAMERWNCWNLHSYFCYPLWFQQAGILKRSLLPPVMFVGLETILTIYSRYIYHKSYLLEWFKPTLQTMGQHLVLIHHLHHVKAPAQSWELPFLKAFTGLVWCPDSYRKNNRCGHHDNPSYGWVWKWGTPQNDKLILKMMISQWIGHLIFKQTIPRRLSRRLSRESHLTRTAQSPPTSLARSLRSSSKGIPFQAPPMEFTMLHLDLMGYVM